MRTDWLTSLPIKELGYDLNKNQFWDAIKIRYTLTLPKLPSECSRGSKYTTQHALSCKKGGFVTLRHNEVGDITGKLLGSCWEEVCKDV